AAPASIKAPRASVAVELLDALPALLRFDRQRRHRTREESRHADRLAGFPAVAVASVLDHPQGCFDLLQELPFPVARAELQRVLLLERRAVRGIGRDLVLAEVLAGVVGVAQ